MKTIPARHIASSQTLQVVHCKHKVKIMFVKVVNQLFAVKNSLKIPNTKPVGTRTPYPREQ